MLFSHSFCLHVVNFRHSDWSIAQNVNKHADWLTLFALVYWTTMMNDIANECCPIKKMPVRAKDVPYMMME